MRINSTMSTNHNSNSNNLEKIDFKTEKINIEEPKLKIENEKQEKVIVIDKLYSKKEIMDIIEDANEEFVTYDRKFEFGIHEKTKQITVKVLDSVTNEVIRELPPEKILDMLAGLWEIAGLLIDESI